MKQNICSWYSENKGTEENKCLQLLAVSKQKSSLR
jgi:hypothetical protein